MEGWELQGAATEMGSSGEKKLRLARPFPLNRETLPLQRDTGSRRPLLWGVEGQTLWKAEAGSGQDILPGPVPEPG